MHNACAGAASASVKPARTETAQLVFARLHSQLLLRSCQATGRWCDEGRVHLDESPSRAQAHHQPPHPTGPTARRRAPHPSHTAGGDAHRRRAPPHLFGRPPALPHHRRPVGAGGARHGRGPAAADGRVRRRAGRLHPDLHVLRRGQRLHLRLRPGQPGVGDGRRHPGPRRWRQPGRAGARGDEQQRPRRAGHPGQR
eukprot:COSAG04_NODE_937_length_9318_cov_6.549192_4_plen_197_part_00